MPAILSFLFKHQFTPLFLTDCKFYEDDLLFLPRPQRHIGVVWTIWVNCNIPPRSTSISHDWAFCSRLVLAVVGGFLPTKLAQWVRSASCPTRASLLVSGVRRLLTSVGRSLHRSTYVIFLLGRSPLVQPPWEASPIALDLPPSSSSRFRTSSCVTGFCLPPLLEMEGCKSLSSCPWCSNDVT